MELVDQQGVSQAAISIHVRTITQEPHQRNETHELYVTKLVIYVLNNLWRDSEHMFVLTYEQSPFKPMTFIKRREKLPNCSNNFKKLLVNGKLMMVWKHVYMRGWWGASSELWGHICAHQGQVYKKRTLNSMVSEDYTMVSRIVHLKESGESQQTSETTNNNKKNNNKG